MQDLRQFELITDIWRHHAATQPQQEAIVHWRAGAEPYRWTWRDLIEAAETFARGLALSGVQQGDVCALLMRHEPRFYPLYLGVCALGAIPSVLAYPNPRLHPDKFRDSLVGMAQKSGLKWLLTEKDLAPTIRPLLAGQEHTIRDILLVLEPDFPNAKAAPTELWPRLGRDQPLLLQHSSGTTGLQKAVELSHRAVIENLQRYGTAIEIASHDKVASWLPLYHDMGLIATFHLPLAFGLPVIQIDPFEWVRAPHILLEAMSRERCTLSWLPNFAYNLIADRYQELADLKLDHVRMLVNCSEPVRAESHTKLERRLQKQGLGAEVFGASYAMAEMTFAVTQTKPGRAARVLSASRSALKQGRYEAPREASDTRLCASSGAPISGVDLRIVDEAQVPVAVGYVGEIQIRSVSMFNGYRNDAEKTRAAWRDGWYCSGDLGFCYEGEYYIVGRMKDLIIVAGKNIYPEDIEDAISAVPGILPGRIVAFGLEDADTGTEKVAIAAETEIPSTDIAGRKKLHMDTLLAGMRIDITISEVFLVPPRWLIKSSSGKLSRQANRARLLSTAEGSADDFR